MNKEEVIELLKEIKPEVDFEEDTELIESGLLDSIDFVSIIGKIEEKYGVEVSPDLIDPDNFINVDSIVAMLENLLTK